MATDLDEMFTALGRQADNIPLGTAAQARQRGRERTRNRAITAAAAAVLVVAVGAGFLFQRPAHNAAPPATRQSSAPVEGPAIPDAGAPIGLGDRVGEPQTVTDGTRAYAAWDLVDGSTELTAVTLADGREAWSNRPLLEGQTLHQLVSVPGAVLVTTGPLDSSQPADTLHALDPATGEERWSRGGIGGDQLVFTDQMLIRLTTATGVIRGSDWKSGATSWTLEPAGGDLPVRVLGMSTPADEDRVNAGGAPADFADGRFVAVTAGGLAAVRDGANGHLQKSTSVGTTEDGSQMVADNGWLYARLEGRRSTGAQHVRASDLIGDGGSAVVYTLPADREVWSITACGAARVCVSDYQRDRSTDFQIRTVAIDARTHRRLWQAAGDSEPDTFIAAHGRVLLGTGDTGNNTLIDATGKVLLNGMSTDAVWLDPDNVLLTRPGYKLIKWNLETGRQTDLGTFNDLLSSCASTKSRLVCPLQSGTLHTWRVG